MDLFEYQGKQFFASFDMPVSPGEVATTVMDSRSVRGNGRILNAVQTWHPGGR